MPIYRIEHSFALSQHQKNSFAEKLTYLHSTEFLTPSLFVNVFYARNEPGSDFFLAGKPVGENSPNRIMGTVRVGPKRTKERWDKFALKIQDAWYEVVNGPKEAGVSNGVNGQGVSDEEKKARKLHIVGFTPVIAGLENGVILPSPDNEATWLIDNMDYFKEMAEVHGDQPFKQMLQELQERPDLRKLIE